jgi:hypothetical protein
VSGVVPEGCEKAPFRKYDLPNQIRSLRPLLADLWASKRKKPNPMLPIWKLGSLNQSELLILELVGSHEDFNVLEMIHNGSIKEDMTKDGSSDAEQSAGWHGEARYADDSGLSLRQVTTILKGLDRKNYIKVWSRGPGETTRKRVNRAKLAQLLKLNDERTRRIQKTKEHLKPQPIEDATADGDWSLDEEEERFMAAMRGTPAPENVQATSC